MPEKVQRHTFADAPRFFPSLFIAAPILPVYTAAAERFSQKMICMGFKKGPAAEIPSAFKPAGGSESAIQNLSRKNKHLFFINSGHMRQTRKSGFPHRRRKAAFPNNASLSCRVLLIQVVSFRLQKYRTPPHRAAKTAPTAIQRGLDVWPGINKRHAVK